MIIRQLTIETLQMAEMHDFYCNILGLPLTEEDDCSFSLKAGQTEIVCKQHAGLQEPLYHIAFNIPANKINEAAGWVATKAERLYMADYKGFIASFINWNAKSVYFYDPAGNVIELISRFDLNNATDQPFDAEQLVSVSEVGLVFIAATFESQTQQVLDQFNLSYFAKQPPMEHFKAVGDDEGLFIIVPENRVWYPTEDKKAIIAPIKIYFSHNATDGWIGFENGKYEMKSSAQ